jgi:hypothetical protein
MSHANDAFCYALFLFVWYYMHKHDNSIIQYALLGFAAGLCALVRTQNAMLVIFPLLQILFSIIASVGQSQSRARAMGNGLLKAGAFSAAWWVTFLPQLFVWHTVFGAWLPGNPYAHRGGGTFDFLHPHIFGVLFSTNRGLFIWTPLILLCVLGWFFLWRKKNVLASLLIFNFIMQVYLIAAWSSWDGAVAFGQRFFTNMVPAFALGLAALTAVLNRYVSLRWLVTGCMFFIVWNGLLLVRYVLEDIPRSGPVPAGQLFYDQLTVGPRYFWRILQILVERN